MTGTRGTAPTRSARPAPVRAPASAAPSRPGASAAPPPRPAGGGARLDPLDRTAGRSAYLQIEEELAEAIERGDVQPGRRLPPERELGTRFGVSRMTVRQAFDRLERRGLIVRRQGAGTFAAEPRFRQSATVLRGFFDELAGQGALPTTRLLSVEERPAPPGLAHALELAAGETVYTIVRVRSAHGDPIVIERASFPSRIVPGLPDHDLEHGSIYRLMDRVYGARPVRASQTFEAIVADAREAELLDIEEGSPLMLVERTSWDGLGRAVELARDVHRADRSRFVTELRL